MQITIDNQTSEYDTDIVHTIRIKTNGLFFRTGGKTFEEASFVKSKIARFITKHGFLTTKTAQALEVLLAVPRCGLRSDYGWDEEDLDEFSIHNCGACVYDKEYWALIGPNPHKLKKGELE